MSNRKSCASGTSRRFQSRKNRSKDRPDLAFEKLESRTLLATYVPGELLVQFDPTVLPANQVEAREATGSTLIESIHTSVMKATGSGVLDLVRVAKGMSVEEAARRFKSIPGVLYAEPNWIYSTSVVSNDTHYANGNLWGMYSNDTPLVIGPAGTTNTFGSQAEKAWNAGYTGSSNVVVGVIDEGIQILHPDLTANIWVNPFDPVDGIDNDGNGFIDDTNGWDFVNNDRTVYDSTSDDHGTHVAGTIGAVGGNGIGVAGVNWNVTMVSLKFLGTGGGTTANAVKAVDYLTDLKVRHGMNVVTSSNSWGGGGFSQGLSDAIGRGAVQNILFVAAAGNANANNDAGAYYPGNYNTTAFAGYDAVISVANITSSGAKSSSSSYGLTTVDLGAPGTAVVSTVPSNSYASYTGTSMATPHVAGAIALYRSVVGNVSAASTRAALLANVTATASMNGITVTGGRLDVAKLITAAASPTLNISGASVVEGNSGTVSATFTVSLTAAAIDPVTINYATSNQSATSGSDYLTASGSLSFAPGELSKTVSVTVYGETLVEPDETFVVTLSGPVAAALGTSVGVGTIVNDDSHPIPNISIADVSAFETNSGSQQFSFTVSLSSPAPQSIQVSYVTAPGTATAGEDYQSANGTVSFSTGQSEAYVLIDVFGDTAIETDEDFFVNLFDAVNATIVDSQAIGVIRADDYAGVSIGSVSAVEGNSGTTSFVFQVSLSQASPFTSEVSYQTLPGTASAGVDYNTTSGTLVFLPGETVKDVVVTVVGDTEIEADENFTVELSNPVNLVLGSANGIGTIVNDDVSLPGVRVFDVAAFEGNSGTVLFKFKVTLSAPSTQTVSVRYNTSAGTATSGTDYVAKSGILTFTPGQISQFAYVTVKGDTATEADETFFVNLYSPINAVITDNQAVGTILNDELALPGFAVTDFANHELNSSWRAFNFTVTLSRASALVTKVYYNTSAGTATAGSDYQTKSGLLIFSAGQVAKTISIAVYGDTVFEDDETFFVNLFSPVNAVISNGLATGTIINDDTDSNGNRMSGDGDGDSSGGDDNWLASFHGGFGQSLPGSTGNSPAGLFGSIDSRNDQSDFDLPASGRIIGGGKLDFETTSNWGFTRLDLDDDFGIQEKVTRKQNGKFLPEWATVRMLDEAFAKI